MNHYKISESHDHFKHVTCFCQVLVIFTDGVQTQDDEDELIKPGQNAQKIKDKNATIFAVGAGTPDPIELLAMATDYNVIRVNFDDLGAAVEQITSKLCRIEITVSVVLCFSRELKWSYTMYIHEGLPGGGGGVLVPLFPSKLPYVPMIPHIFRMFSYCNFSNFVPLFPKIG